VLLRIVAGLMEVSAMFYRNQHIEHIYLNGH
jgi:hypothetical protein